MNLHLREEAFTKGLYIDRIENAFLVVAVAHDRFLESDEVRWQSAEAIDKNRLALFPSTVLPP